MSTNSFYNRASDTVRADPEIVSQFGGDIKTYGADTNQRREGRRFHVPEYRYTLDNVDYLRCVAACACQEWYCLPWRVCGRDWCR